ncbi:MAG: DNA polymerase III subunit delta [Planctomycetaceae bacterium]|nr:DNA polymerase III subunit delta [Planctomycetaceae bacterium]
MHATQFLRNPAAATPQGLIVLTGGERYLKQRCLEILRAAVLGAGDESSIGETRFNRKELEWKDVRDELHTVSMFTTQRLVVVEEADDFITKYRSQLEEFADSPTRRSVLVLDANTWRKNTRLAKKVDESGLELECSELKGKQVAGWLTAEAKARFEKRLPSDAATLMTELAGTNLGLLNQELEKLVNYVGDRETITSEDVTTLVGGWKAETTWTMIDAIRDNNPDVALACLDKLFVAGEPAPKILGGMNFVFRKIAKATEISRSGTNLRKALQDAGMKQWEMQPVESYLKRIQRPRAERILERLAEADFGLKGGSRLPERLQMEQLILWLMGKM